MIAPQPLESLRLCVQGVGQDKGRTLVLRYSSIEG